MSIKIVALVVLIVLSISKRPMRPKEAMTEMITKVIPKIENEEIASKLTELINIKNDEESCEKCKTTLSILRLLYNIYIGKEKLKEFVLTVCKEIVQLPAHVCEGAVSRYSDVVVDNLVERIFNDTRTCADLEYCNHTIAYETIEEYAERVLKNKPETKKKEVDMKSQDIIKVAQITDIHFDEKYIEGGVADCNTPSCCCRELPKPGEEDHILGGKYGANSRCESNLNLMQATAEELAKHQFDYLLFTGDVIRGEVWGLEQEDVTKAMNTFIKTITDKIGMNIPIIPVIGNHEKFTVDQFKLPETDFLATIANAYKPWLTTEAYESLKTYGYYTMKIKGIKLIVINCLLCDSFNWNLMTDNEDSKAMIKWLENELDLAEKNDEPVHLIDHFPIGNGQQYEQCSHRLRILIERYQNTIKAYISGHTHKDEIFLIKEYYTNNYFFANYAESALNPREYKNPSIRIYEVDQKTKLLKDFVQIRMDIAKSNTERTPFWKEYYRAYKFLNQTYLFDADALKNINISGDYLRHRFSDNEAAEKLCYDEKTVNETRCMMLYTNYTERNNCMGGGLKLNGDFFFHLMGLIAGNFTKDY